MMQSLLADRFKLVVHRGEQATAAYALSVGKDKPKLTESAADEKSHCDLTNLPPNADGIANEKLACRHITMGGAGKCTAGRFRELSAQLSSGFHRIEGRL
jgi:uncharacterized protein (TIGR03435 family)